MNKEEALALYAQGREAWNAWAEEKLDERRKLEEAGGWQVNAAGEGQNDATTSWLSAAMADFADCEFKGELDLSHFIFPGRAKYNGAVFSDKVVFSDSIFSHDAVFNHATFKSSVLFDRASFLCTGQFNEVKFFRFVVFNRTRFNDKSQFEKAEFFALAGFEGAVFSDDVEFVSAVFLQDVLFDGSEFLGYASFDKVNFRGFVGFGDAIFVGHARFANAKFSGLSSFDGAIFKDEAEFVLAKFDSYTHFDLSRFELDSQFHAIEASSAFSLNNAHFLKVPDFIQAEFSEPPRLDNLKVDTHKFCDALSSYFKPPPVSPLPTFAELVEELHRNHRDAEDEARWRWLKKLAVDGHDHGREQEFFRGELVAQRWHHGAWRRASFWFGLAYQILSDFGRSLWLPLLWLGVSIGGFAWGFLVRHQAIAPTANVCVDGTGSAISAALGLSLRNTLLFASAGLNDAMTQMHGCLWGWRPVADSKRLVPAIPDAVAFMGVAQNLLSAVLIFLFLLALRNHFRIK